LVCLKKYRLIKKVEIDKNIDAFLDIYKKMCPSFAKFWLKSKIFVNIVLVLFYHMNEL